MNTSLNRTIQITNSLSGDQYRLVPLHEISPTKERLQEVQAICNEPLIYQWCFKDLCKGKPYPEKLALDWFQWAKSGWEEDSHYVYAVLNPNEKIAAACDIKSSNREHAEVGYWARSSHRGIMTNAVSALIELAKDADFINLFADIHPENQKSLAVIKRCGFIETDRPSTYEGHISHDLKLA